MAEQPAHPSVAERPAPALAGRDVPIEPPAAGAAAGADGLAVVPSDHPTDGDPEASAAADDATPDEVASDQAPDREDGGPAGDAGPGEEPERSPPTREEAVAAAIAGWRAALSSPGRAESPPDGSGPDGAHIDLTSAHPSGLAQLLAGRPTRLSSLVREPGAQAVARRSARMIRATATQLAAERGVRGCFLAAGQVSWTVGDTPFSAPVLLRGCTVRPRGAAPDDYDLDLDDGAVVNAEVLRGIATGCGVRVDGAELGGLAFGQRGFDPHPVYEWLEEHCAEMAGFRIERSLVVATFTAGSGAVLADLDAAAEAIARHDLLSRIALRAAEPEGETAAGGAAGSAIVLAASARPGLLAGGREVDEEPRPLDLDPAQRAAVEAVAKGGHVAIEGPPGTGTTRTLVAAAAGLAAAGRRVLVLCPRRVTAETFLARLDEAGLGGLALDVRDGDDGRAEVLADVLTGLDAAAATTEEAGAADPGVDPVADPDAPPAFRVTGLTPAPGSVASSGAGAPSVALPAQPVRPIRPRLLQARDRLAGASSALHSDRMPWGVSAYDAMVALTELMARPNPPRTRVRLPEPVLARLDATTRERMRTHLHLAAAAGGFSLSSVETRWFEAQVRTDAEARRALAAARDARDGFPEARERMAAAAGTAGLAAPPNVAGWRPLLELLLGVRETLDVMLPAVYEQPLDDLIDATGPAGRLSRGHGGWVERARRRRRAAALVRPGVHVPDLNAVLQMAAQQRARWLEITDGTGWPAVPTGLDRAWVAVDRVEVALEVLADAFAGSTAPGLTGMPLPELERRLDDLAGDPAGVLGQPRRTTLLRGLDEAGLGPLVEDLRARRAGEADVDGELDLAWWGGVLESIVNGDARLARHDGAALRAAAGDLREGEHDEIARAARRIRITVAGRAVRAADQHPDQVRWLRDAAADDPGSSWLADLFTRARDVVAGSRPIWLMSPDTVARALPVGSPGGEVDAVLIDDAGNVALAEAVAALSRSRWVVVAGDRLGLPAPDGAESALSAICTVTGVYRLDRSHRALDARLLDPVRHRYDQRWVAPPGAAKDPCLRLQVVREGVAVPAPGEELAVSSDAEVRRVVDLVVEHATLRPRESLIVITLGERHAERVEAAVRSAAPSRAMLRRWLEDPPSPGEPLVIRPATRALGLERDAAIVSVGLARTPHGRLLHRFGVLDEPGGAGCLTTAMTRARRRITVVCCFTADELQPERLHSDGARLLRDVLEIADGGVPRIAPEHPEPAPDALLADLRNRLATAGMPVHVGVGDPDWPVDVALSDPQAPGSMLLAADLDSPRYAARGIRERDRQRPEGLEQAGWAYYRVSSLDLFRDPAAEVDRIRRAWIRAMLDQERRSAVADLDQSRRQQPDVRLPAAIAPTPEQSEDDTDPGWGERRADNDERLLSERPPHWE